MECGFVDLAIISEALPTIRMFSTNMLCMTYTTWMQQESITASWRLSLFSSL
ncbi:hypothetical protein Plhal304r1_c014g0052321 [Plasmopara halstedii]